MLENRNIRLRGWRLLTMLALVFGAGVIAAGNVFAGAPVGTTAKRVSEVNTGPLTGANARDLPVDAFLVFVPGTGGTVPAPVNGGTVNVGDRWVLELWLDSGTNTNITAQQSYLTFTKDLLDHARVSDLGTTCTLTSTLTPDLTTFDASLQNEICNGLGAGQNTNCIFRGTPAAPGDFAFASGALSNPETGGFFRVAQIGWCAQSCGTSRIHWQFTPPAPPTRDTQIVNLDGDLVHNPTLFSDYIINIVGCAVPTDTPTSTPVPPTNTPTNTNTPAPPTSTLTPTPFAGCAGAYQYLTPQPVGGFNTASPPNGGTVNVGQRFTLEMFVSSSTFNITAHQAYLTFTQTLLDHVNATQAGCVLTSTVTPDLSVFDASLQNEVCNGQPPGQTTNCVFRGVPAAPGSFAFASGALSNPSYNGPDFRVAQIGWCAEAPGQAVIHWQFDPPAPPQRDTQIVDEIGNLVHVRACYVDYIINITGPTNTPTNTAVAVTNTPTNTPVPPTNTHTDTPVPPTNTHTDTPVPPTNTFTNTPVPPTNTFTNTPVPPTNTFTNTPAPPTNTHTDTPVPPTNTHTNTPAPATNTHTDTPVPPTNTFTNTPVPSTNTHTNTPAPPTNTFTNTPVPPTNTFTNTPAPPTNTFTNTPVPPTNTFTNTPVPPTNTFTRTPVPPTNTFTNTPVPPTNTHTNTPAPATNTFTNTPVPPTNTFTNTPVPPTNTFTRTPVPPTNTFTNTPVPLTSTVTNTPAPPTNTFTPRPPTDTRTPTNTFTPAPPTNTRTNTPIVTGTVATNTRTVTNTRTSTRTRTATRTRTPCGLCNLYFSDATITCNPDGAVHWSARIQNNAGCTVSAPYKLQLQLRRGFGGQFMPVQFQRHSGVFPPGNTLIEGDFSCFDPNQTEFAFENFYIALDGPNPNCNADHLSNFIDACQPVDPCAPMGFRDVSEDAYYADAVRSLVSARAVSGYSDNTFRPANATTRGQLAKIVVTTFGLHQPEALEQHFSDVPAEHPFFAFIETAYAHNLVSGYSDGTFRPHNDVTRGQVAKIVVQASGRRLANPNAATFSDVPVGSPYFQFVETAYTNGFIGGYGDGTFRPNNPATRGQIVQITARAAVITEAKLPWGGKGEK